MTTRNHTPANVRLNDVHLSAREARAIIDAVDLTQEEHPHGRMSDLERGILNLAAALHQTETLYDAGLAQTTENP